jgi:gamma-glutamylcyclotransferase (GGCT)/AIG2-like uncharacterized protein YtfP
VSGRRQVAASFIEAKEMSECLFVYGTLLPGRAPAEVANAVSRLRRVGPGHVQGRLYDFGDYPGAILDRSSQSRIPGQVFELPDDESVLASLDEYEEFSPDDPAPQLVPADKITCNDGGWSPTRLLDVRVQSRTRLCAALGEPAAPNGRRQRRARLIGHGFDNERRGATHNGGKSQRETRGRISAEQVAR